MYKLATSFTRLTCNHSLSRTSSTSDSPIIALFRALHIGDILYIETGVTFTLRNLASLVWTEKEIIFFCWKVPWTLVALLRLLRQKNLKWTYSAHSKQLFVPPPLHTLQIRLPLPWQSLQTRFSLRFHLRRVVIKRKSIPRIEAFESFLKQIRNQLAFWARHPKLSEAIRDQEYLFLLQKDNVSIVPISFPSSLIDIKASMQFVNQWYHPDKKILWFWATIKNLQREHTVTYWWQFPYNCLRCILTLPFNCVNIG